MFKHPPVISIHILIYTFYAFKKANTYEIEVDQQINGLHEKVN